MHNIGKTEFFAALGMALLHCMFSLFVILSSIWLCLALWFQEPLGGVMTRILIGIWIAFALSIVGIYATQAFLAVTPISCCICLACSAVYTGISA